MTFTSNFRYLDDSFDHSFIFMIVYCIMKVIISGGGIVGASTAYYLNSLLSTTRASRIHLEGDVRGCQDSICVIDASHPAASASGKAGGFLALDWNDSTDMEQLARVSYGLHMELSLAFKERCDYRRMNAYSGVYQNGKIRKGHKIGSTETTMQVTPRKLTLELLKESGCNVLNNTMAVKLLVKEESDGSKSVCGLRVKDMVAGEEKDLDADIVVFAHGAWSNKLFGETAIVPRDLLSSYNKTIPSIEGLKVHSIVVESSNESDEALFLSDRSGREPEVYPRKDGTVYVCGNKNNINVGDIPIPNLASEVLPEEDGSVEYLFELAKTVTGSDEVTPLVSQACYLPCSDTNRPIIGEIPGIRGAYIAAGHSCWGILLAPATGKALSELIVHGQSTSVDLQPFSL
jgi:glycine/D-amino acid oxidase-like deaminating enzyme